MAKVRNS